MPEIPDTRHSLLVRLRDTADERAWGEFVTIFEPAIYGFARKKGLQDADARVLCQEVLRSVARAIDRWLAQLIDDAEGLDWPPPAGQTRAAVKVKSRPTAADAVPKRWVVVRGYDHVRKPEILCAFA